MYNKVAENRCMQCNSNYNRRNNYNNYRRNKRNSNYS